MAKKRIAKKVKQSVAAPQPADLAAGDGQPHESAPASQETQSRDFAVVGIGASAGGLEAFTQVLQALPARPGLAIIFVQHLAPKHESALPALLGGVTALPVTQVVDGASVEIDHVYVIPPNVQMELRDGKLRLVPRPDDRSQFTSIDFFFRSLAAELQTRAIGVVLSGTASDGSDGLREIKAVGGITLAQDPASARYSGMPQAAINTGAVDLTLAPAELAAELVRISRHPYVRQVLPRHEADELEVRDDQLPRIFAMLKAGGGVDFSHYKTPTIKRRLQRRMALHRITSVDLYARYLEENQGELKQLYQDVLIHVTRFFREPESFAALAQHVFPAIVHERSSDNPIRIWVPGCSTGEEPYSVAMALLEYLGDEARAIPVQIFATDVSESAIDAARAGVYPPTIAEDVSAERLRRFFVKTDGSFRISKAVRDMCVFARQDLTRDPPFSKLDLIACRNVLIYLGLNLQKRLMSMFHYALKSTGFLMLGSAETTGPYSDMFSVVDKKHRIHAKKVMELPPAAPTSLDYPGARVAAQAKPRSEARPTGGILQEANQVLLDKYAPPAVVVDSDNKIIQFRGQTGAFLTPAPGEASLDVLKMARDGLLYGLRTALHAARQGGKVSRKEGLRVKDGPRVRDVNVEVVPLVATDHSRHYLVLFEDVTAAEPQPAPSPAKAVKKKAKRDERDQNLDRLQEELAASRDYLQSIIQDLEAANEELQSANEEILSSNEELQSTNEELDTAKEELQSTNEELNTVNEELHGRNEELSRVNSDLMNLLSSVQIAIVIVSHDLRIRRFTPVAERLLNLIPGDVGRPIGQIKPNIDCPDLEGMIRAAIENIEVQQRDVRDNQGRGYTLLVRPYKNVDHRIDGAVVTLYDLNEARLYEAAQRAHRFAQALMETVHEPLLVLDGDLRVRTANRKFCERFQVSPQETENRLIYELGNGQWDIPQLRDLLKKLYSENRSFESYTVEHDFPEIGLRRMRLNARRIGDAQAPSEILLAIKDVTDA